MTSIHSENFPRSLSILFHLVAFLPLMGFVLYHGFYGSLWLSAVLLVACVMVLLSLRRELQHKDSLPYRQWFVLAVSVGIVYACHVVGLRGLIYVFPMAPVFFFTFSLKYAVITGTVFSVASLVASSNIEEPVLVIRFAIGITICMVFAYIFAFVVNKQKEELERQASVDELTGAMNRRTLRTLLEDSVEMHKRHHVPASLILIDLDHFKIVNDCNGHLCGDQILIEFTRIIQARVRLTDKVFRFGGEEFLILLPGADQTEAEILAEALRQLVEDTRFDQGIQLTCSMGVAQYQANQSLDHWLQVADQNLYAAKDKGRNCIVSGQIRDHSAG